jgi:ATP-dependent Clp protease protease subunit
LAQTTIGQLLILEQEDPEKEIKVFINSPGGDADAGFAIYDMMKFIKPKIKNICAGVAASAAVIILLGADKKAESACQIPEYLFINHQLEFMVPPQIYK